MDLDGRDQSTVATLGRVMTVSGAQFSVGLVADSGETIQSARVTVGKFVGVACGSTLAVGVITDISIQTPPDGRALGYRATAQVDLMGEINVGADNTLRFHRGVVNYPAIGDTTILLGPHELQALYELSDAKTAKIGHLHHDERVDAYVKVDDMLSKHFAILGTTGVGKSSGVAIILREILAARPDMRIFLLDPHNEYDKCFGDRAQVINPANLRLPFWLFNFEEMTDVIFGGRPGVQEEIDILSEVIPLARGMYTQGRGLGERLVAKRIDAKSTGYNVDTPVPYRLNDLIMLIDDLMGKLENRSTRMIYHRLITRLETLRGDPRYAFMFDSANVGGDTMAAVLNYLFRLVPDGPPMTVMQLGGFPVEVVDSVVSVLCRMAFDFGMWSNGAAPLLFVCEEAHRYASRERPNFTSTRRSLSRIAKEGRKYGVFLGLVTQRPAELDPTIISQCSTLFIMRLSNDRDQALLRSAVSDAAANLFTFVPSLSAREVLVCGEGVALPTRLTFKELPKAFPLTGTVGPAGAAHAGAVDLEFINAVVDLWRGATTRQSEASFPETEIRKTLQQPPPPPAPKAVPAAETGRSKLFKSPPTQ